MSKREAVIVATARTGLAKSFRGSLNLTRPEDMVAHCIRAVMPKFAGGGADEIAAGVEDVIIGCGYPSGVQGMNIARVATLLAGLPVEVAGATVNRFCSSGLQAVAMAAWQIINEGAEIAIGGGVESITMLSADRAPHPEVQARYPGVYMVMGETAELVARRYGISRAAQDEYALSSQQRTARAQQAGRMAEEIAPWMVTRAIQDRQSGKPIGEETVLLDRDECNRPETTIEGLSGLKPHFDQTSGEGTVTAGNSSQLADGASVNLLMSRQRAEQLGLAPLLVFRGLAVAGCAPEEMGIGPVHAVPKLLKRHGLTIDQIDLWELNEAFAVQVVYCRDRLGIDPERMNVNGGSISIGHPFGMTGSRLVGTLGLELRRRGGRYGVVTMCIGGGQGMAGLFESV
ncbi:MAG: thiolase family protein [Blastocatellia bacterium]